MNRVKFSKNLNSEWIKTDAWIFIASGKINVVSWHQQRKMSLGLKLYFRDGTFLT